MVPQLIFGTPSFGMEMTEFQDADSVKSLLVKLKELGISRLDTAARYPPLRPGRSEELLGETRELSSTFTVDTKVLTDTRTDGSGDLSQAAVQKSFDASLHRLKEPNAVNVLYAHRSDPSTPLEQQIQAFQQQISLGHCKAWGLSNVKPGMLKEMLLLCDRHGWQKPSWYQGTYNVITRGLEKDLLPILREHGIAYAAYGALAAGFLTGKLVNNQHAGTRAADDNPLGKMIQKVFGAPDLHAAMKKFDEAVKAQGLSPAEVAVRWVAHHSALQESDAIVLGTSRTAQIVETVGFLRKGPLPSGILPLVEDIWSAVKDTRGEII